VLADVAAPPGAGQPRQIRASQHQPRPERRHEVVHYKPAGELTAPQQRAGHHRGGDIGTEFAGVNLMHEQRIEPRWSIGHRWPPFPAPKFAARSQPAPAPDEQAERVADTEYAALMVTGDWS
jgi:hypothetical protein